MSAVAETQPTALKTDLQSQDASLENGEKPGEQSQEQEDFDWNADMLNNPMNWSSTKKWVATSIVAMYTFIAPLSSSIMAPGLEVVARDYHITNPTITAMTLSIFQLSFAVGPMFLAPASEMYGRRLILHVASIISLGFTLGCAYSPTTRALIAFRFLAGFSGSAPVAVGAGVVSDMFAPRDRASAMALYSLGPLLGPVIGPVMGGFIASSLGIKYVFIVLAGFYGITTIIAIPLLRETYAPVIRHKLAMSTDPKKALLALRRAYLDHQGNPISQSQIIWVNLKRPIVMLFTSSVCFQLSLYIAFVYGTYYLLFATFSDLFSTVYGWGPGISGLAYISLGVGFSFATIFGARFGNYIYIHLTVKNGGVGTPEMRVPALIFGSLFVPIGLFWYGWSAQAKLHFMMPIVGTGIFGFGFMTTFLPVQLYLVDAFQHAASAISAAAFFRAILGFAFPLFSKQMYDALGTGGGNSLLAGLAIVLGIPFPIWLWYNGAEMRKKNKLTR